MKPRIRVRVRSGVRLMAALSAAGFAASAARAVSASAISAGIVVEVLRELRGDVNLQSVALSGMSPLEADLATSGEDRVKLHGWAPPYPEVSHLADAVAAAEAQTARRMREIYGRVDAGKVAALAEAVATLTEVSGAT